MSGQGSDSKRQSNSSPPPSFSPINEKVVIVEYNPEWPDLFEHERTSLLQIFGDEVVDIEHIGSSSVPGLASKNRVDILVGVSELGSLSHYFSKLQPLNYFLDSIWTYDTDEGSDIPHFEELESVEVIRMTFMKRNPNNYNLHIVEYDSKAWVDPILFRDFLRSNPQSLHDYETLKQSLSESTENNREYTTQKSEFIQGILQQADQHR